MFFIIYPYVFGVLIFKLCVVMWYTLVISLETLDTTIYKKGKRIYVIVCIVYATGGSVLVTLLTTSLDVFLGVVLVWIMVPLIPSILHCAIQIFKMVKHLRVLDNQRSNYVLRKNVILAVICIAFVTIGILTGVLNIIHFQPQPDWWAWIIVYFFVRLNEFGLLLLLFFFVEQYTTTKMRFITQTESTLKSSSF
eukprot:TRINITY_DN14354_c0_g2_i1.p1 TRINITY_DN14354_c0_g2~~TRINITY_DN14354_c0_g2_i1.p1  ORF type:complete len:219 (-),score=34.68 TRINITY_DN14354_c0_g2_i1:39-620(-)